MNLYGSPVYEGKNQNILKNAKKLLIPFVAHIIEIKFSDARTETLKHWGNEVQGMYNDLVDYYVSSGSPKGFRRDIDDELSCILPKALRFLKNKYTGNDAWIPNNVESNLPKDFILDFDTLFDAEKLQDLCSLNFRWEPKT